LEDEMNGGAGHPPGLVEGDDVELELEQVAKQLFPSSHANRAFCNNIHSF
jgi:hypothetical protein